MSGVNTGTLSIITRRSAYSLTMLKAVPAPLLIIASQNDIFFRADKVFKQAEKIFKGPITTMQIDSPHLPPEDVMIDVCNKTVSFFKQST